VISYSSSDTRSLFEVDLLAAGRRDIDLNRLAFPLELSNAREGLAGLCVTFMRGVQPLLLKLRHFDCATLLDRFRVRHLGRRQPDPTEQDLFNDKPLNGS
jgi:hypothetical protein